MPLTTQTKPDPATRLDGRRRVVIENVQPVIDSGRFPAKHIVGDGLRIEADILVDGHDRLAARASWRHEGSGSRHEAPMVALHNDRWMASVPLEQPGAYAFAVEAWVDAFGTWRHEFEKRAAAGQDLSSSLLVGARLVEEAAGRAESSARSRLLVWAREIAAEDRPVAERTALAREADLAALVAEHPDRSRATRSEPEFRVQVDDARARASAWYELFPRSSSDEPGRHGTLRDCERRLPLIAQLGFDVVYLPPIHPVGTTSRKGPNNAPRGAADDVGSPWAIGSTEGGHKAIHPRLGTLKDFDGLVATARKLGIELAMDLAFQCSPDHPYVKEHPEWFRHRPDGSIAYAENPPKKYEDIYPFDFETEAWKELWTELKSIVDFWIGHGIRRFRVDNPHTKPFPFWEWLLREVRHEHPDVLFLAEAFTRPKIMYRLAKLGFDHSYTYFAWRNTKWDLTQYFSELSGPPVARFFRPHLWPNTPDILTEPLQSGDRAAFIQRYVLAATLSSNFGIYGPAFELLEHKPRVHGSEEYQDSEKYQVRTWDWDPEAGLRPLIAHVNRIRRENPALRHDAGLRFHGIDNEQLVAYSRRTPDGANVLLVVVTMDTRRPQVGFTDLDLAELGLPEDQAFQVHELLTDSRYVWRGRRNFVELRPHEMPAHIFRLRTKVRTEADFDYYA